MKTVGIIGGSGYVAGELMRCLMHHPSVVIDFVYSHSNAGKLVSVVHTDFLSSNMTFSNEINSEVDVVFLCLGHGNSKVFLAKHNFSQQTKIIDLSNDFRLSKNANFDEKNI